MHSGNGPRASHGFRGGWGLLGSLLVAATVVLAVAIFRIPAGGQDGPAAPSRRADVVVIVSFDGLRPDAIEAAGASELLSLIRDGAYCPTAQTTLPPITLVSHASMLTGVGPARHGIWWNAYEPERGFVRVPTCLAIAHASGLRAIAIVGKEKLRHLFPEGSVDRFIVPGYPAATVARAFAEEIARDGPPDVAFLHFADPDGAGHAHGWMSAEQLEAVRAADGALRSVVLGLGARSQGRRVVFVVTADHGGLGLTHGRPIPEDVTIPWLAWGAEVRRGVSIERSVSTCDTAATTLWLLGLSTDELEGRPVFEAFE